MQRTSLETVRVLLSCSSLSPFALVCSWALPSLTNLALPILLHHRSLLLPHLTSRRVLLQHHSILSLLLVPLFPFSAVSPLHNGCRPYRLLESGLTTHCPCQLKTGPVSSRQIHMSIVYTPLFTSSLITVPSRVFRMCGFISSSTTIFPARTTCCIEMRGLTTLALQNVMHL